MSRRRHFLLCLLIFCVIGTAQSFADEQSCAGCHGAAFTAWQGSHHAAAMAVASKATLRATTGVEVVDNTGTRFRVLPDGESFIAEITEQGGDKQRYPLRYTFGIEPLQQYLVDIGGGRLQALPVAFDTRPTDAGGQRWFALDTDLHWRSFGFNWNTSCADCHSTDLRRNYDVGNNRFSTTWSAINVACGACHQGIEGHREWLATEQRQTEVNAGFERPLPRRGRWHFRNDAPIAERADLDGAVDQLPMCARCHAHRTLLDDHSVDSELLNQMNLSLLEPGLYHSDGQIEAEVYVTGSFLQSKMHAAGVVCSDCHDPHSLQLRAQGNGVCLQCHRADQFDAPSHHGHIAKSEGAQCVNCHMPTTTYMVNDPRRDHRFGIPDPGLTGKYGIPNACGDCHADRGLGWIDARFDEIFPEIAPDRYAHAIAAFDAGAPSAAPRLQALANDRELAPIKRASAQLRLGPANPSLPSLLASEHALIRLGALRSVQGSALQGQLPALWPHLQDPVLAVRLEAIRLLEPLLDPARGQPELTPAQRETLVAAIAFRREQLQRNADHPAIQMDLGVSYEHEGKGQSAQQAYEQALRIEPDYVPAMLNLAELKRRGAETAAAAALLDRAVSVAPDSADAQFAMGLHRIRQREYTAALTHLEQAAILAPGNLRYIYTLAVAQEQTGDIGGAIATLRGALGNHPRSPVLLRLITQYAVKAGRRDAAQRYLQRWRAVAPEDPAIAPVARALRHGG